MSLTWEKVQIGTKAVLGLQAFPIFCGYLLMITLAGKWKKISKPLELRPLLVIYNFSASLISAFTMCGFIYGLSRAESSFQKSESEILIPVYKVYWLTKLYELLDTVFMIVRHKQRQISFLHVYHHSSMIILSDVVYHLYPYPAFTIYLALNSMVHVVLYAYYGLSALYPDNPPKWKKFLTQFQIIQFLIDMVHAIIGYLYHGFCIYGILYGITMISLFSNFYYQAYIKVRKPQSKDIDESNIPNGTIQNTGTNNMAKKLH